MNWHGVTFPLVVAQTGAPSPFLQFVPILVIFVIFYFLLIAPMRKRQKALQNLIANLKRGDRVVTTGGIHGEVAAIEEKVIHLKVADKVKIRVSRSAIAGLDSDGGASEVSDES